jgi:hypothetical protein
MKVLYCPVCEKPTGHQRKLGFGTLFAIILTLGWWLLAIPFYPKRCSICGQTPGLPSAFCIFIFTFASANTLFDF